MGSAAPVSDIISFGPFSLVESERLITKNGAPVDLGARALDVLIALVSRPNEIISKRDLIARVWADVTVDEGSLRFHIANLRKALGDGKNGARYITTIAGRGYCFVAPISRSAEIPKGRLEGDALPHANIPNRLTRMMGRDKDVTEISAQLIASRFLTILGPGGVGKTTVAVAVAHSLAEAFGGTMLFVDLSALSNPALVPTSLASMLGLSVQSDDVAPSLVAYLRDKRLLLILDNCEHLIEAVAILAARLFEAAAQVYLLATSREALRAEGENIYKLPPLACPPESAELTADIVRAFPATQLFMERVAAGGTRLELSDDDAVIVAGMCRKLDGMPLSIGLAAGRIQTYGLKQTADLLDERLTLLWRGHRTAPARQQTLQATLDWSYRLLSELERIVLRRLAVFVGQFSMEAALAVAAGTSVDRGLVFSIVDSLVAKSMIATHPVGAMMRYRLLDTTRAYVLADSTDSVERANIALHHASYCRRWLEQFRDQAPALSNAAERMPLLAGLNNVRAALEWSLGSGGDAEAGIELACAAAPVFFSMSLITDCQRWSERALLALSGAARNGAQEMHLQAAVGLSLMFSRGNGEEARLALTKSLAIASTRGDVLNQVYLNGPLHLFRTRIGEYRAALDHAKGLLDLLPAIDDPAAQTLVHVLLASSFHLAGELDKARDELEAIERHRAERPTSGLAVGLAGPIVAIGLSNATSILARTLWLQGRYAEARAHILETVETANRSIHPVTYTGALTWAVSLLLWMGDLDEAQYHLDRLVSHAQSYSLRLYLAVGAGFRAKLGILRGDAKSELDGLRECLAMLREVRYELLTTEFNIALVQGLAAIRSFAEALKLVAETIGMVDANGDFVYMPELLRLKGNLLLATPDRNERAAEGCFAQALALSRQQGARAWELRATVDHASHLRSSGRDVEARALLLPMLAQFSGRRETADLRAAESLLASLR